MFLLLDNECTTPCGQEGLHEGQYWCHTYDSWKFCNPIYLSKGKRTIFMNNTVLVPKQMGISL